ncbi:AfsR/SARP family transcriptional regulator [Bradyrhizobium sp. HKCCYLR20261]|uniref:AfsR/SARP family transcriptional regulator n=1 Tax=unclassified Bradyrhizobium TaxID=2631580 RepID=UPI003EB6AB0B
MGLLRINLFGGVEIRQLSGEEIVIPSRKAATLLGYLALTSPHGISRGKLAALLWEGRFGDNARANLRQTLLTLRRMLPQCTAVIATERDDLRVPANAVSTDVQEFEHLLRSDDLESMARAAELFRGELLDGISPTSCAFEAWLSAERQRLRIQATRAIAGLLDVGGREHVEIATTFSLRVLAADPLQEDVHRTLMRCYAQQGRRADALRQYDFCRSILRRQVGAVPESETESLQREIRRMMRV